MTSLQGHMTLFQSLGFYNYSDLSGKSSWVINAEAQENEYDNPYCTLSSVLWLVLCTVLYHNKFQPFDHQAEQRKTSSIRQRQPCGQQSADTP